MKRQDSCPISDLATVCEMIEQGGRCSVEVAAASAVADERPGEGNGQMRLPVPGHQSTRHWTNAIKGISPPGGGEQEGEEMMERRLDDVIAALPEERRERVDARFQELRREVESFGELRRAAGQGPGRDCLDPQDQAALGLEDREAGRYVSVDA